MYRNFSLVVLPLAALASSLSAQDGRIQKPADYLMERTAEISLARSAAPPAVSDSATILVLQRQGFAPAVEGHNGFVCYVARSMVSPPLAADGTPSKGFFNPKIRAPHCMNAEAARTIGAWHALLARMALAGSSQMQIDSAVTAALASGELVPPQSFAVAYMWSPHQHLGARIGAWKPHMMVYQPYLSQAMVGDAEPLGDGPQVILGGTPWSVLVVPVREFAVSN